MAALAALQLRDDRLDPVGDLGDQDHVRAAGDPALEREEAGVSPHHLEHHHPLVRLGGGVQLVDRVGAGRPRGVEAERLLGAGEIVVDRLRAADDLHAELVQAVADREGAVAADRDQPVEAELAVAGEREVRPVALDLLAALVDDPEEGVRLVRGAEDRAAAREDSPGVLDGERPRQALAHQALVAVLDPDERVAELLRAPLDDRADERVQPRAISAACEHSQPHASDPRKSEARLSQDPMWDRQPRRGRILGAGARARQSRNPAALARRAGGRAISGGRRPAAWRRAPSAAARAPTRGATRARSSGAAKGRRARAPSPRAAGPRPSRRGWG